MDHVRQALQFVRGPARFLTLPPTLRPLRQAGSNAGGDELPAPSPKPTRTTATERMEVEPDFNDNRDEHQQTGELHQPQPPKADQQNSSDAKATIELTMPDEHVKQMSACGHRFCSRRHYYKSFDEGDGMRARAILAATILRSMAPEVEAQSYIDLFDYNLSGLRNLDITMLFTVFVDIQWIVNLLALIMVIALAWWLLLRRGDDGTASTTSSTATPTRTSGTTATSTRSTSTSNILHRLTTKARSESRCGILKAWFTRETTPSRSLTHHNIELQGDIRGLKSKGSWMS